MINEVTAFEINGNIFATKEAAEKYKFQRLDDVELGDVVMIHGYSTWGVACCIEGDKIYFAIGGYPPASHLGHIRHGFRNVIIDGISYNFDIGIYLRRRLIRLRG